MPRGRSFCIGIAAATYEHDASRELQKFLQSCNSLPLENSIPLDHLCPTRATPVISRLSLEVHSLERAVKQIESHFLLSTNFFPRSEHLLERFFTRRASAAVQSSINIILPLCYICWIKKNVSRNVRKAWKLILIKCVKYIIFILIISSSFSSHFILFLSYIFFFLRANIQNIQFQV